MGKKEDGSQAPVFKSNYIESIKLVDYHVASAGA